MTIESQFKIYISRNRYVMYYSIIGIDIIQHFYSFDTQQNYKYVQGKPSVQLMRYSDIGS